MELAFVIFDHQASAPTWAGAPAPPEAEARASYADYLAEEGVTYFVAERGDEPLGHLILERVDDDGDRADHRCDGSGREGPGSGDDADEVRARLGVGPWLPRLHHGLALREPARRRLLARVRVRADGIPALPLDYADAALAAGPGPDAAEALGRDAGHASRRRIRHGRERRARPDVGLRQLLEKLGRAAVGDPGLPVDDEVLP